MIWLYRLLFIPAFTVVFPYYLLRMLRRGGYSKDFRHRLGLHKKLPPKPLGKKRVWIQAVSVGEIEALSTLVNRCAEDGNIELVITTTTSTGYKILRDKYAGKCLYCGVFPIDFAVFSASAWRRINPDLCVLMEGELWPEHIHQAQARGIKIALINARLSDRSFKRYLKAKFLARRLLNKISMIFASGKADMERFLKLGADPVKIICAGNMKFDSGPDKFLSAEEKSSLRKELGFEKDSFVLLGSSTWAGEEEMMLEALIKLRSAGLEARLLLTPRHAERRGQIIPLLEKSGFSFNVRSRQKEAAEGTLINLADTTGELRTLTQSADLAFVGKSMPPNNGGQTPLDCACLGVPLTYGPNMTNFRLMCKELEEAGAAVKTQTPEEEIETLLKLAQDAPARAELARRAKAWHAANAGSVSRVFDGIKELLK